MHSRALVSSVFAFHTFMLRNIFIIAAGLALSLGAARAASVASLVAETLRRNPELEYYRAAIAVAQGERRTAGEYPNPEIRTELGSKVVSGSDSAAGPLGT